VSVVLLHTRSNQLIDLLEMMPQLRAAVRQARPGRVTVVEPRR
jgi:hypothetical protein